MNQSIQIVVGVTQVDIEPWKTICDSGQKLTWMRNCPNEIQIVNLYGKKPNNVLKKLDEAHEFFRLRSWGNGITNRFDFAISQILRQRKIPNWYLATEGNMLRMAANISSTYVTQVIREFSLFKYFLEQTNARFLYMTNTSSYVNLDNLLKFSQSISSETITGGSLVKFEKFDFYSGSNRIFSRDVVEILLQNFKNVDYRLLNDVAIGKILAGFKLKEIEIPSLTFSSSEAINQASKQQIKESVHFRLKSGTLQKRNDVELMKAIHRIVRGNQYT